MLEIESNYGPESPKSTCTASTSTSLLPGSSRSNRAAKRKYSEVSDIQNIVEEDLNHKTQKTEDEFDIVGKNIANKLRRLPSKTAVVTEKLVMDILFEAFLGNINKYSKINIHNSQTESTHNNGMILQILNKN